MLVASSRTTFGPLVHIYQLSVVRCQQEVFCVICTVWTLTAYFASYPEPVFEIYLS